MHRLVIVRHGNTFAAGEPLRRVGAHTDMPLTADGLEQARAIGARFAADGLWFAAAYTGPLVRTRATAHAILAAQPAPPPLAVTDFLIEVDHGPDENALEADVVGRIGADALATWDRDGICPPDWRDDRDMRLAAWRDLAANVAGTDGATLLVTSNGAARFARIAFGLQEGSHKLRTGAWGTIAIGSDGASIPINWDVRP